MEEKIIVVTPILSALSTRETYYYLVAKFLALNSISDTKSVSIA
jgi:hypothetical protein